MEWVLLNTEQFARVCLRIRSTKKINSLISCLDHKLKTNKTLIAIELHLNEFVPSMKIITKVTCEITISMVEEPFRISFFLWDTFVTTNTLIGKKPLVDCTGSLFYRSNSAGAHFRSWQFTSSFPFGNLFSFRNSDNVLGKISVHIFAPTEG